MFRGARPAGTVDRQARGNRRDASRGNFRADVGPADGDVCGHPAAGISGAIDTPKTDSRFGRRLCRGLLGGNRNMAHVVG